MSLSGSALVAAAVLAACGSSTERAAAYLARAQQLYDQGDYVTAKLEAQNAVQIAPRNGQAHYLLALVAEKQNDSQPMVQQLLLAVESDPKLVAARIKLGTLYFFGQAFDLAAEQAQAATALAPADPAVRVLNARLMLGPQNDRVAGIRELDAALAANPDLVDAILLRAAAAAIDDRSAGRAMLDAAIARLGREQSRELRQMRIALLAEENRKVEVEQAYRDLIGDFPKDEQFHYQLARFYADEGRVADAEKVMREFIAAAPGNVEARLNLAQILAEMRSPEAAEQALDAFVQEDPGRPELRVALARLYETDGKPGAALIVYEELARLEPKSKVGLDARVRVAALRIGQGETRAGAQLIDDVLALKPDHPEALLIRAGLRVDAGQLDEAVGDVRTVLREEPQNRRAMLLLARVHARMGEKLLAKDAYRRLLQLSPNDADGSRELAMLETADGHFSAAEDLLRARLKDAPGDLATSSQLITLLAEQRTWGRAEEEARRIAALPDDRGAGQLQLGRLLRAQSQDAAALEAFRSSLEKNPASAAALEAMVGTLIGMGRRAEAMQELANFRARNPADLSARFLEGTVLAQSGEDAAARKIFEEIVAARPAASQAWAALADLQKADSPARIAQLRRGLAASPGNAELGLLLGAEYARTGQYDAAIAHYEELLAANPRIEAAANNLAALLLDYRQDKASHARALQLVEPLAATSNPLILDTVGWAFYRNGDAAAGLKHLERAVASRPDVPMMRYHLGMSYLATKDTANARKQLRLAVDEAGVDYPGRADARAKLRELGG